MEGAGDAVRCLALPIVGEQALVPNAVVAEVLSADSVARVENGPQWLLGSLTWRGSALPLVCMEAVLGGKRPELGGRSKVVVMKALTGSGPLHNYAFLVQGIPHQVLATGESVEIDESVRNTRPFVALDVQVEGHRAFIPDLDAVEQALIDVIDDWQVVGGEGH